MRIPRYEEHQVGIRPIANNVQTAQMSGNDPVGAAIGQAGRAFGQVSDAAIWIARDEQDRQNLAVKQSAMLFADQLHKNAEIKIKKAKSTAAFGSEEDPIGVTDKTLTDFNNQMNDWITQNVKNDAQRDAVENIARARLNSIEHTGLLHEISERDRYQEGVYKSSVASAFDRMAIYAVDPLKQPDYKSAFDDAVASTEAFAKSRNWSKEQTDLATGDIQARAAKLKATQLITLNPTLAKTFIDQNKDFLGSDYTELKKSADLISADQEGMNLAISMGERIRKGEDITKLLEEGAKSFGAGTASFNYKAYNAFESQLKADIVINERQRKKTVDGFVGGIFGEIIEIEGQGDVLSPKRLRSLPSFQAAISSGDPDVMQAAYNIMNKTQSEWRTEQRMRRAEANAGRSGRNAAQKESWDTNYLDYANDPDKLAGLSDSDFKQIYGDVGAANWKKLDTMRRKLTSPERLAQVKIENSMFKDLMGTMGITDKSKQASYMTKFTDYLTGIQKDEGRVLRPDEIRKALVASSQQVEVQAQYNVFGFGVGSTTMKKRLIDVENPEGVIIPKDTDNKLDTLLSGLGIKSTKGRKLKLYREVLGERGGK